MRRVLVVLAILVVVPGMILGLVARVTVSAPAPAQAVAAPAPVAQPTIAEQLWMSTTAVMAATRR